MALVRPIQISTDPNVNSSALNAINTSFDKIENLEPWHYVSDYSGYQNSWSDAGNQILRVRFRKTLDGIVYMENQPTRASAPAQDTVMFTLPNGYWPQNSIDFIVPDVGAGTPSITQIRVDSRGVSYEFSNAGGGARFPYCQISYVAYTPK